MEEGAEFRARFLRNAEADIDELFAAHVCRADFFGFLDQALGGQAVIVEPHGVEHVFAVHALEAGDEIGLGVAEHMAHMQRA